MTTAIATTSTSANAITAIQATRVSKKGAVTVRDLLGLMLSGSRTERTEAAASLVSLYWTNGQFAPLAQQMSRVYGKDVQGFASAIGLDLSTGKLADNGPVQIVGGNRAAYVAIVKGLTDAHTAKPFKGEKALLLSALQAHIQARAAMPAPEAAPALTDSTAPTFQALDDEAADAAAHGVTVQ